MASRTYTTAQAADKAGITRQTLYFWVSNGLVEAAPPVKIGRRIFRLWSERDVQRLKEFKGTLHPGPKKKARKP